MKRTAVVALCVAGLVVANELALTAQDQPVVFIHGLNSNGGAWANAADRLKARAAIDARLPGLDWRLTYESQADQIEGSDLGALPAASIAIGHSNGGLVARQWSRHHPLAGIITVGTPHQGAPIVTNLLSYTHFNDALYFAISDVFGAFSDPSFCCDWSWIIARIGDAVARAGSLTDAAFFKAALTVGLTIAAPVFPQMDPVHSTFLAGVNSEQNLQREMGEIPSRVGIASIAHNFYWGGPIRAAWPDDGDRYAEYRDLGEIALDVGAIAIEMRAEVDDTWALDLANRMWRAAALLGSMDDWWCRVVSWPGRAQCWANDTVVPIWSQDYGRLGAIPIVVYGPAHVQETARDPFRIEDVLLDPAGTQALRASSMMDDLLYDVMTRLMHVPPR
jgi:pimeloyl-ACP methyl ester carboxylesterase